jgi:oxygen-independent coproporphyrinogen III oxidase
MDTNVFATALARSVPRYTSYPTAPQFCSTVSPETYTGWLGGLTPFTRASVYLHIPYCQQLCWYCGCHTRVASGKETIRRYCDALVGEIGLVAGAIGPRRPPLSRIHWGGGTPTVLTPDEIRRIHEALTSSFDIAPDAEIAVEIDPRTLSLPMVDTLKEIGTSRVSFGVQDFEPAVQAAINRFQPFDMTRRAIDWLRNAGIKSINLDLVYGLPLQTEESVQRTARMVLALAPDRIALFGYAHVPWLKRHQSLIKESELPGPAERWRQAQAAAEILTHAGYIQVGIDHFALPADGLAMAAADGRLHRNFQGYTDDESNVLIGLGASAISSFPAGYAQNTADIPHWLAAIESGTLATTRGVHVSDDDRIRRSIIERLMCDLRVDLRDVASPSDAIAPLLAEASPGLQQLERLGIVTVSGPVIQVAPCARPLTRVVASTFDAYLSAGKARHSAAV